MIGYKIEVCPPGTKIINDTGDSLILHEGSCIISHNTFYITENTLEHVISVNIDPLGEEELN